MRSHARRAFFPLASAVPVGMLFVLGAGLATGIVPGHPFQVLRDVKPGRRTRRRAHPAEP
jgi:hypothetical protein